MSTFSKDLADGQRYEKLALKYFKYKRVKFPSGCFKPYDFILDGVTKVEVKSDKLTHKTGNIAIEYRCNGKKSGIRSTQADFWVYFVITPQGHDVYKVPVDELKAICVKGRKMKGGDGNRSRMYLVKKDQLNIFLIEKYLTQDIVPTTYNMASTTPKEKTYTTQLIEYLEAAEFEEIDAIVLAINAFKLDYGKRKDAEKKALPPGTLTFGKYKGKTVADVAGFDSGYLEWLVKQQWFAKFDDLKGQVEALI